MNQTIHVTRIGRKATTAVELVYSPDDVGYYLSNTDFQKSRNRVSVNIYTTDTDALTDWHAGTVAWEDWY